ncbi:beta-ketoacyl synthase domain-containing protein [Hypoxylon sp. FL1857]|nr:beta-ketoacyl synthase domain-containing protein [Hypoxylon sp. FL1857]
MAYKQPSSEPIAVVGVGCRFAGGATSPAKLWDVLCEIPDLSREVPSDRFNATAFYHPDGEYHGTTNSIKAYWLDQDHRVFDAAFFNITPKEAEAIDPQQRLLLEVVYEAMESAGYTLNTYSGKNVAVFSGVMTADYDTLSQRDELSSSQYYATGNARSIISNRISYFYNFQGPSMTIDTACSSSLVALHQGVLSLRSGESTMACVTGVNLMITPEQFLVESSLHMLSPTGKSRMWDVSADGYARGEGVAALLLKPLSQALADGDEIMAIVRETGVNSDGRTKGITLPNPQAQTQLIKETYRKTGLDSMTPEDQCQYFEAHGTGTPAGDPREAQAIYEAFFGRSTSPMSMADDKHLLVGSLKTIVGHTEGAAGLAGLLKVILAMKHGLVPPNLHLNSVNPDVEPFCTRLEVPTSLIPWPQPPAGQPKRASVNSFGFGGANAHVIVESYDPHIHDEFYRLGVLDESCGDLRFRQGADHSLSLPLLLSATSQRSLRAVVSSYRDYLLNHAETSLDQLAWAIYSRRTALPYRLAVSASSRPQALEALKNILNKSSSSSDLGVRNKTIRGRPKILGVFTGQGAQWATMSRSLFRTSKVYRDTIRNLDAVLGSSPQPPDWTLEEQIMAEGNDSLVHVAAISQPLCTALQVGLVDLLRNLGIDFHTVVGHSSGEIAAAYAAAKISAREAILISYYRGYFAHLAGGSEGEKGGMLAAGISEKDAQQFCEESAFEGKLHVAASNAPASVTLSGDLDAIQKAHAKLTNDKKFSRILRVDSAYHSPHMMKPAVEYAKVLHESNVNPDIEGNGTVWVSSVHGRPINENEDLSVDYWRDNMVNMVRFHDAVVNAVSQQGPFDCALEIGPHPALKGPFTQNIKTLGHDIPYSSPLDRSKDDSLAFSDFLGFLWAQYGPQDANLHKYIEQSPSSGVSRTCLPDLPSYPWDHSQIHYRESRLSRQFHFKSEAPHELLGVRTRDDNEHELRWRNILKLEKIPWAEHHSFQGHALFPASAYCVMALDAARYLLNGRPASLVELHDLEILSGMNVDRDSVGAEVLSTLAVLPSKKGSDIDSIIEARFTLASCPADGTTAMRLNMTGNVRIHLGEPTLDALPSRYASRSEAFEVAPESFYKMMDEIGLTYTGPFRALTSIQRRYNYCSATLERCHPEDTTSLQVSPATLDSCFQSAFLTYASPGDRSLWTSFLPVRIDRICFNLATTKGDRLAVDTHMAQIHPSTPDSKATFVVDMGIFNEGGDMEVRVEGLTVSALAHTLPKDDYELCLSTVMDVDPTDEIVRGVASSNTYDAVLVESCARVATFFVRNSPETRWQPLILSSYYEELAQLFPSILGTMGADYWSSDTKEVIDDFIQDSDYYECLNLIRELENYQPDLVVDVLHNLIDETQHLSYSNRHVGRIVRQVAHKYPRMKILGLAGPDSELLVEVLSALGSAFSSFTVGTGTLRNPGGQIQRAEVPTEKVFTSPLDLTKDLKDQLDPENTYDLVLLSASELENSNHVPDILKRIRAIMRPGSFLIVVQQFKMSTKDRYLRTSMIRGDGAEVPTPPQWPDVLDTYGFIPVAKNCNQSYYPGYTVMVRQVSGPERLIGGQRGRTRDNLITDHLLIIGCDDSRSRELVDGLQQRLSPLCRQVSIREGFGDADSDILNACTAVIILADLWRPVTARMTQKMLDQLRDLLRPNMKALWLTLGARFMNPDAAATFGFTRTVSAEIPSLTLQMLDLESLSGSEDVIVHNFVHLVEPRQDGNILWTDEREIHMEGGRRFIPRVLPLKPSNDGVNSMRRVVSNPGNSLQQSIRVAPIPNSSGLVRYETRTGLSSIQKPQPGQVLIRVDYSSVEALRLDVNSDGHATNPVLAYMCFGYNLSTDEWVMAMSASNASYISLPSEQIYPIKPSANIALPLISLAMRYLMAIEMVENQTTKGPFVLIDSDPILTDIVAELVSEYEKGGPIILYSTASIGKGSGQTPLFLHPRASAREIKKIFPLQGAAIFDFQPLKHANLSEKISGLLPSNCKYYSRVSSSSVCDVANTQQDYRESTGLRTAASRALAFMSSRTIPKFSAISLPMLQSHTQAAASPFQVIDWRADRNVARVTENLMAKQIFRADKTYVLFGLTKDFGQSLCYLLVEHGARNVVLASRKPRMDYNWIEELAQTYGANIRVLRCDVTEFSSVRALKEDLSRSMPPVGGIVNGAMVLDDRVFAQMDEDTWQRVLRPKTVGSRNLHDVFSHADLEFFIMTSSFAAIGGHPGQSNYAAANMYMNGLAGMRRERGQVASVLNIGVIYGLGFLHREKEELYAGLEREGYPPISERDIHHMFLEAVITGCTGRVGQPGTPIDITTGLRRFDPADPNPLHWHQDPRFSHYSRQVVDDASISGEGMRKSLKDSIAVLSGPNAIAQVILDAFTERLHTLLQLPKEAINAAQTMSELGVDSLAAVDVRGWIFKTVGKDVSVIKLLGGITIQKLLADLAEQIVADRSKVGGDSTARQDHFLPLESSVTASR